MHLVRLITLFLILWSTPVLAGAKTWQFYVEEVEAVNDGSYRVQLRLANPESSFYCKNLNVIARYEPKKWQFSSDKRAEFEHLEAIHILKQALQKKEIVEFGEWGGMYGSGSDNLQLYSGQPRAYGCWGCGSFH